MNGPGCHLGYAALLDADQGIGVVDRDNEGGVDEAAAADEIGVGVHEAGDVVDHALPRLNGDGSVSCHKPDFKGGCAGLT